MPFGPGLYYPYIHFRDESWLKMSALFWPSINRIVPHDYRTHDSHTVEVLQSELDFVHNLDPQSVKYAASEIFLDLLKEHGFELTQALGKASHRPESARRPKGPDQANGWGYIYHKKLARPLLNALEDLDLASGRSREGFRDSSGQWIGMDERLVNIYMCVLASLASEENHLTPVTDSPIAQLTVTSGWNADLIASLLLDFDDASPELRTVPNRPGRTERVACLALELAIPRGVKSIPIEDIVIFRKRHSDEVSAFQMAVGQVVDDLSKLSDNVDQSVFNQYVKEAMSKHIIKPKKSLEAALRSSKWETLSGLITANKAIPITGTLAAAGVAIDPLIGSVASLSVGIATHFLDNKAARKELRTSSPAANYLLEMESTFNPTRRVNRFASALHGRG